MNVTEPAVVRIARTVRATPERVFAAWTDAASLGRWLSPVGHAEAIVEPRVGGRLKVVMIGDGVRIEHTGEYLELVPGRRLVFTWRSPYTGPQPSRVTIDLAAVDDGTLLTLTHEQLPSDQVESHGGGWGIILDRLSAELAREPEPGKP